MIKPEKDILKEKACEQYGLWDGISSSPAVWFQPLVWLALDRPQEPSARLAIDRPQEPSQHRLLA
jgi:hypothetical protein